MPAPHRRAVRGFSMVEMVVTLVMLGLLIAFTFPKVTGSRTFAEDQKAQTSASGALDSAIQLYLAGRTGDGTGCAIGASTPRKQLDPGPYPANEPTNCPVFANATDLHDVNGDVQFVNGDAASTGSSVASVGAMLKADDTWRVAVAVLAPQAGVLGEDTVSSCWIAWREFPGSAGGTAKERYFSVTNIESSDVAGCSGNNALGKNTDAFCEPAGAKSAQELLGMSWRRPCPEYGPAAGS